VLNAAEYDWLSSKVDAAAAAHFPGHRFGEYA
jgi:hypothetical protein